MRPHPLLAALLLTACTEEAPNLESPPTQTIPTTPDCNEQRAPIPNPNTPIGGIHPTTFQSSSTGAFHGQWQAPGATEVPGTMTTLHPKTTAMAGTIHIEATGPLAYVTSTEAECTETECDEKGANCYDFLELPVRIIAKSTDGSLNETWNTAVTFSFETNEQGGVTPIYPFARFGTRVKPAAFTGSAKVSTINLPADTVKAELELRIDGSIADGKLNDFKINAILSRQTSSALTGSQRLLYTFQAN